MTIRTIVLRVFKLLALGCTLFLTFQGWNRLAEWWRPESVREVVSKGGSIEYGRFPVIPVTFPEAARPQPGTPVYLEAVDSVSGNHRLFLVGEVVHPSGDTARLAVQPRYADLLSSPLEIEWREFRADGDSIRELLLSKARTRELWDDLRLLGKVKGDTVVQVLQPLLDKFNQDLGESGRKAIEINLSDFAFGFLDGKRAGPKAVQVRIAMETLSDGISKLLASDGPVNASDTLGKIWGHVARVEVPVGTERGKRWVGLKDLFDRYFFVGDVNLEPGTPGRMTGFSPEITIAFRGILYGKNGEKWPGEQWIVLRRSGEAPLALSTTRTGKRFTSPGP